MNNGRAADDKATPARAPLFRRPVGTRHEARGTLNAEPTGPTPTTAQARRCLWKDRPMSTEEAQADPAKYYATEGLAPAATRRPDELRIPNGEKRPSISATAS
jgi:hypothetical protein